MKILITIATVLTALIWGIVVAQIKVQINDIQDTQKSILQEVRSIDKLTFCKTQVRENSNIEQNPYWGEYCDKFYNTYHQN